MSEKGRSKTTGLRFSEEEFLQMKQRLKGKTASTENNITETQQKPGKTEIQPKTSKKAKDVAKPVNEEDPDWTAPRTAKVKKKTGKTINTHVKDVIESIKTSIIHTSTSENHLSLVFDGARLLTLNELLSLMPYQPYLVYNYKTAWKNKIDDALILAKDMYGKKMPEFADSCVFVGFRRSTRLVDRDGLPACFKYILDDLRNQIAVSERILKDDNPNLIVDTPCFQVVGSAMVGVRLERVQSWQEPVMTENILLSKTELVSRISINSLK